MKKATNAQPRRLLDELWAKTPSPKIDGQRHLPLLTHLADACEVAERYWDEWAASNVRHKLIRNLGGDAALARKVVRLLAAAHDLGKCTPAFQGQAPLQKGRLGDAQQGLYFPLGGANKELPHSLAGAYIFTAQLEKRDWNTNNKKKAAHSYASAIAGHHGTYPTLFELSAAGDHSRHLGHIGASDTRWSEAQDQLFERCLELAGLSEAELARLAEFPLSVTVQCQLQGIVVLADWTASNTTDFPLSDPARQATPQFRDPRSSAERAAAAWSRCAIPGPWLPKRSTDDPGRFYHSRFGWEAERTPKHMQLRALEIARQVNEPGLLIIEAGMGHGKTEAALAVAEEFAARTGAGGVFFGLPTMAMSDAMLERVLAWIRRDPSEAELSVFLAHSKAAHNDNYTKLPYTAEVSSICDEQITRAGDVSAQKQAAAVISEALSGRRTGIFANMVVGTVDQLLMVALNTKHFALRHLAMSSKVVILDEIHSADRYMQHYLVRALEWLGAYGTPVILLSATLPPAQREEFVRAYLDGVKQRSVKNEAQAANHERSRTHRGRVPGGAVKAQSAGLPSTALPARNPDAYPVITWTDGDAVQQSYPEEPQTHSVEVELVRLDDDLDVLVAELRERTRDGGCVLIVRNTVQRALETYDRLREDPRLKKDLTLAHSRFIAPDRAENDEALRRRFGPPGSGAERPGSWHPAIVVATQVAEQSLDIDFDLLVTDLAPADLVLQRIGRLHRHEREDRPAPLATPVCILTGVDGWDAELPRPVEGSARVYGEYALLRSMLALEPFGVGSGVSSGVSSGGRPLVIPADIPRIVREAYAGADLDSLESDEFRELLRRAKEEHDAAAAKARERAKVWRLVGSGGVESLYGSSEASLQYEGDELARAAVRDGEDTFEVILMQRGEDEATLRTLPTLSSGARLPVPICYQTPVEEVAWVAAASTVRLPAWLCVNEQGTEVIRQLETQLVPSWQEHRLLRGQLVLVLDEQLEAQLADRRVRYSRERGLEIWKA